MRGGNRGREWEGGLWEGGELGGGGDERRDWGRE